MQIVQRFEFNAVTSSLELVGSSGKDGAVGPAECVGDTLSRLFSTDGSTKSIQNAEFLECLAALRSNGWTLMCSDILSDKPGWAMRTFFFESSAPSPPPPPPPPPPSQPISAHQLSPSTTLLKDDPMYAKYFKMLKYGLPVGACKIKMTAEGVDPSVRLFNFTIDFKPNMQYASHAS